MERRRKKGTDGRDQGPDHDLVSWVRVNMMIRRRVGRGLGIGPLTKAFCWGKAGRRDPNTTDPVIRLV